MPESNPSNPSNPIVAETTNIVVNLPLNQVVTR